MRSNYTVCVKFVLGFLTKSRRIIIDWQINSILENCSKTVIVEFRQADVLGFTPQIKEGSSHILLVYRIDLKTLVWCAFYG